MPNKLYHFSATSKWVITLGRWAVEKEKGQSSWVTFKNHTNLTHTFMWQLLFIISCHVKQLWQLVLNIIQYEVYYFFISLLVPHSLILFQFQIITGEII